MDDRSNDPPNDEVASEPPEDTPPGDSPGDDPRRDPYADEPRRDPYADEPSTGLEDESRSTGDTLVNALIGAVVTVVLSFTGLSPIVGGAVAGYLERRDGLRVGAISGLIAVLPLVLFAFVLVTFLGFVAIDAALFALLFAMFAFSFLLVYTVTLSALGGYLGVYLYEEFEF